jgi:hypothetical protein
MKSEIWVVLENVEEIYEITQFFKLLCKKIGFKGFTPISQLPLIGLPKFQ